MSFLGAARGWSPRFHETVRMRYLHSRKRGHPVGFEKTCSIFLQHRSDGKQRYAAAASAVSRTFHFRREDFLSPAPPPSPASTPLLPSPAPARKAQMSPSLLTDSMNPTASTFIDKNRSRRDRRWLSHSRNISERVVSCLNLGRQTDVIQERFRAFMYENTTMKKVGVYRCFCPLQDLDDGSVIYSQSLATPSIYRLSQPYSPTSASNKPS